MFQGFKKYVLGIIAAQALVEARELMLPQLKDLSLIMTENYTAEDNHSTPLQSTNII